MTRDEKLALISGNIREVLDGIARIDGFLEGTMYELVLIAKEAEDSLAAVDTARLVLPETEPELLAEFCRIYHKYYGDYASPYLQTEISERSDAVAIPEIPRLYAVLDVLQTNGIYLKKEYGDSFASCAEDVEYGNSGYVLMPYSDPTEGRLRTFDRLRSKYGLKIHCVIYIEDDEGAEYSYQLCGLGFSGVSLPAVRLSFTAESTSDPVKFLEAVRVFGARTVSAEFEMTGDRHNIRAALSVENTDSSMLGGLIMYLNTADDVTIDGMYTEIHHKP